MISSYQQLISVKAVASISLWCVKMKCDASLKFSFNFLWDFLWRTISASTCDSEVQFSCMLPISGLVLSYFDVLNRLCQTDGSRTSYCSIWGPGSSPEHFGLGLLSLSFRYHVGKGWWINDTKTRRQTPAGFLSPYFSTKCQWSSGNELSGTKSTGSFDELEGGNSVLTHQFSIYLMLQFQRCLLLEKWPKCQIWIIKLMYYVWLPLHAIACQIVYYSRY